MTKLFKHYLFMLLALCATVAQAQVTFSVAYKKVSATQVDIVFTGKADAGWHIYSTDIPDGGPTPASFGIDEAKGVKLAGKLKAGAGAKTMQDPIFEMPVTFFEHTAVFTQRVELTEKNYELKGYLKYGACNDENCLPPTSIDCHLKGTDGPAAAAAEPAAPAQQPEVAANAGVVTDTATAAAPVESEEPLAVAKADSAATALWWTPVIEELQSFGQSESDVSGKAWYAIFFLGFLGGLLALVTPCVWPIIPMTVSFFLKRSGNRRKGIRDAIIYGLSIVVIYVALGLIITSIFGASALNDLSTNAIFNILFFLMLVVFGASFLGGFEITLPSSWGAAVDGKAEKATGLLSIFLMAFTLTLVSFSCTGPIIGFLLVEVSTGGGSALAPTIGMLGFALALALPFTLFALFPTLLKSAPKSGGWLNTVKVCLGFVELAFALKFLSVADLAYGWHILDRETFLTLWIALFFILGLYLLGLVKFPHDDEDERKTSVLRFFLALVSIAFSIYMIPGLWGAPCKAVSAFAPPLSTQDFNLDPVHIEAKFKDYDAGMAYARQTGKPVFIDFTGHGCVNCRKMELAVWNDPGVRDFLTKDYVLISLYVDEKTPLPEKIEVTENGQTTTLRTVGDKWSYLQRSKFGANAQPFYVLLDNDGKPLTGSYSYDENIGRFTDFLKAGLENWKKNF